MTLSLLNAPTEEARDSPAFVPSRQNSPSDFRLSLQQALDRNDHATARLLDRPTVSPMEPTNVQEKQEGQNGKKAVIKAAVKAAKKAAKKAFKQGGNVKSKKRRRSEKIDRETDS
jgi:hypothetical protein